MKIEYEVRYYPIHQRALEEKLDNNGFESHPIIKYKRIVYDIDKEKRKWLRIRFNSYTRETAFAIKEIKDAAKINGTLEHEFYIKGNHLDDFKEFFKIMGLNGSYQENERERWTNCDLDNKFFRVDITFDTWPGIGTVLEIEADSEKEVEEVELILGLDKKNRFLGDIPEIYQKIYGISRDEFHAIKELTFKKFRKIKD